MSDDLISRQAAIDAIADCTVYGNADDLKEAVMQEYAWNKWSGGVLEALEAVEELPSAQPEIIRCKDCKHKYIENLVWHCPFGLMGGENFFCGYGSLGRAERRTDEQTV